MTTLPTPEQLVINGLKFFLRMNSNRTIGDILAPVRSPRDPINAKLRYPDGICFYVKVDIWWHELPYYYKYPEQTDLVYEAEELIDKLIEGYLIDNEPYLSGKGILTEERIRVAKELINKLENQNATTSIS